jgi:RimJ/RimL family protein N-acetyltransferase
MLPVRPVAPPIASLNCRGSATMATMPPPVTLHGQHVRLEPLTLAHVPGMIAAANEDRSTYRYTLVPETAERAEEYVRTALAHGQEGSALPFATIDALTEAVVGSTRFHDLDYWDQERQWPPGRTQPRPTGTPSVAEIGSTWLAASAQQSRINTEAKLLMLTHAFEEWKVHRISLKTDTRNLRSRRAIERVGASFEGIRRAHVPAPDGTIRDSAYYSIVASEWPTVRAGLHASLTAG